MASTVPTVSRLMVAASIGKTGEGLPPAGILGKGHLARDDLKIISVGSGSKPGGLADLSGYDRCTFETILEYRQYGSPAVQRK